MNTANEALWRDRVAKVLKGAPFETLVSRTPEGIAVQPLYPKAEGERARALRQQPGSPWRVAQRVDHPDAGLAAELTQLDLLGGADELRIVFAGAASARGVGVRPQDLATALDGVELELVRLSLDLPVAAAFTAVDAVTALVGRQRLVPASLDIDFGLDPITALAATGEGSADWAAGLARDRAALAEAGYGGPVVRADGRIHHDAGATNAEELAAVLSAAVTYLRALEAGGVALCDAAAAIGFLLVADQDQFGTIAKFRALRRLWDSVRHHCGLDPAPARIAAETSFRMCARRDPAVNFLRATTAAFAASVGGADSVTILPYTIALGLPDGFARRMARNAQAILIEESHLAHVLDPAAGSGAVEALTDALCESAWALFGEMEGAGGIEAMLRAGSWQTRLAQSAGARRGAVEAGQTPILGVTLYPDARERPATVLIETPADEGTPRHPLALRGVRDAAAFEADRPADPKTGTVRGEAA